MARAGILYSHVALAAERLINKGKTPTVDSVRSELGNTGSKSTIAPFLKKWKESRFSSVSPSETKLPATLLQAVESLYQGLIDEHREKGAQLDSKFADLRAEERAKTLALRSELDALKVAYEEVVGRQAATRSSFEDSIRVNREHEVEIARKSTECLGLEQRLADRAAEITALKTQLAQAGRQFEHLEQAHAAQREREAQSYDAQIRQLEQSAQIEFTRTQQAESELKDSQNRMDTLLAENQQLELQLRAAIENSEQVGKQLLRTEAKLDVAESTLSAAKEDCARMNARLAAVERESQLHAKANDRLSAMVERHEKVQAEWGAERALILAKLTNSIDPGGSPAASNRRAPKPNKRS